ncbi:hypothetical protein Pmar_PMAR005525, partial [Perkinsus marinus ATCC 50983]
MIFTACEDIMKQRNVPSEVKEVIEDMLPDLLGHEGFIAFFDPNDWVDSAEWQRSRIEAVMAAIRAYNDSNDGLWSGRQKILRPSIIHDFFTRS